MSRRSAVFAAFLAAVVAVAPAAAQGRGGGRRGGVPRGVPGGRALQEQRRPQKQPRSPEQRAMLEQRFHQRLARVVRDRLQLSDDQMARLQAADSRMQQRRRPLVEKERDIRAAMRAEIARGSAANQARVSSLMDQALTLQRQRQAVAEEEQRELATFLTPVQRVQYAALQAQLRRRVQDLAASDDSAQLSPTP